MTGVVVALGCLFLLSAVVAGVLVATGVAGEVADGTVEAGLSVGAVLVVAQFLSYLWGGYTAGRMARGAGAANGVLVPIVALVLMAMVAGVAAVLGATTGLTLPFSQVRLPVEQDLLVDFGPLVGVASVVAMLLGGTLGGVLGARWHTKLEAAALEQRADAPAPGTPAAEVRKPGAPPPPAQPNAGTPRAPEKSQS
jgi:hypothetical protein